MEVRGTRASGLQRGSEMNHAVAAVLPLLLSLSVNCSRLTMVAIHLHLARPNSA
jgi:hypothetical protein